MNATTILPTRNPEWGFWGTTERAGYRTDRGWDVASETIRQTTGCDPEGVRDFLDSRLGRHFADEVNSLMATHKLPVEVATAETANRWQGWKIDRKTSRDHGIPAGMPYLTGWVTHYEIADDSAT